MPKCEIFHRSDFHDSPYFRGSFRAAKFLTHVLSLILRRIFLSGQKELFVKLLKPFVIVYSVEIF